MKRVLFARFGDAATADAAISRIRRIADEADPVRIFRHEQAGGGDLLDESVQHADSLVETDARHGFTVGVTTGVVAGLLLGAALMAGLFGAAGGDAVVGGVAGGLLGMAVGLLTSGVLGAGLTDRRLRRLAQNLREGEVLVTAEAPDRETEERIAGILREHGARIAEKSAI